MATKWRLSLVAGIVLMAASAFAADIDGKWSGNVDTPNGAVNITYDFKAEGTVLTGSMIGPDGAPVKITDGKVDGNKLSFSLTININGMPLVLAYKGEVSGNNLKLVTDVGGMPMEMVFKKV